MVEALSYVKDGEQALDLGAGALSDSRFLLTQGFTVTAVDSDPQTDREAKSIQSDAFHLVVAQYDQFDFPEHTYDLVTAMFALPFNPPDTFNMVFARIVRSLRPGGIFCGQFFGVNDEWNVPNGRMTFHTKEAIHSLLIDMKVIKIKEEEKDGQTANGTPKHWHVFHVIARKS